MSDIAITDQLDKPVTTIQIDLHHPSTLVKYLKDELLHVAVVPDFLQRKDSGLTEAATKPIQFQAKVGHEFRLGNTKPEIHVAPEAQVIIRVNASPGTNLFESDPFRLPAKVPPQTGYVSVGFQGKLSLGVSGSQGDLTFGFAAENMVGLEYLKAFPTGLGQPTLGNALEQTLESYVIPADVADLKELAPNDMATVSGEGSLKVSGAVSVTASPNPLASASLPLGKGEIAVKAGATAGLSAEFTITGSYQVRARCKPTTNEPKTIELSFLRKTNTRLQADFSASAGVAANLGDTDLIAAVLGAISTDPTGDKKLLADLHPAEAKKLADAIKGGLNHSFQASLDTILSGLADDEAAFQYEIQPDALTAEANIAVHKALDGDLRYLTAMESSMQQGGVLAPGLKMLNSVISKTRSRGVTLRINLLGILNFLTISELVRNSEVFTDEVTGAVTIKETVTGDNISAMVEPFKRHDALRKAMFDSVLVTTTYRAGKAVAVPDLGCEQVHFALNQNTNEQTMADYLGWFIALGLLTKTEKAELLVRFRRGGPSTCVLRTCFGDADCISMFLDDNGNPRSKQYYLEIGRQALRALLDPEHQANDGLRYKLLDDQIWPQALDVGANVNLGPMVGLDTDNPWVGLLVGDVLVITDWAGAMVEAGECVRDLRTFVGNSNLTQLLHINEFEKKRHHLQQKMAAVVKASRIRFDEPWGMVCLFWAGGSPKAVFAKTVTRDHLLERGKTPALAAGA